MKMVIVLILVLALFSAAIPASAGESRIKGSVTEVEKYGHAVLDLTEEDFTGAGFELGDIVTVTAGRFTGEVPCLNGYYVDQGEPMVRVRADGSGIALCINYGSFAETAGIGPGDPVTITMAEKAGALLLQEINNLEYTNERGDYVSDEVFANFRAVEEGKLYRSCSPADNRYNRAAFADRLISEAGIQAVLNLADTEEEIMEKFAGEDFASPYYKGLYDAGKVLPLGVAIDFSSDEFGKGIVKGLSFLAGQETPFLIHCTEGKDRAGFTAMILEALMGWSADEITDDYMASYMNYYGIEPGTKKYDTIAEKNVKEMMRSVAGLEKGASLEGTDLRKAAEAYLAGHGMAETTLKTLEEKLGRPGN